MVRSHRPLPGAVAPLISLLLFVCLDKILYCFSDKPTGFPVFSLTYFYQPFQVCDGNEKRESGQSRWRSVSGFLAAHSSIIRGMMLSCQANGRRSKAMRASSRLRCFGNSVTRSSSQTRAINPSMFVLRIVMEIYVKQLCYSLEPSKNASPIHKDWSFLNAR
jgi:hypothetical protein